MRREGEGHVPIEMMGSTMRLTHMKKAVLGSAVVVTWCVVAPTAQQQQPVPTPKTPAHNVFVLTGCVEAGDAPATFKLTGAVFIGPAPPAGAAEAGSVGTSGQKASYLLRPVSGVNAQGMKEDALKAHVGQRVEAVVRPIESPPLAPAAAVVGVQPAKPVEFAPESFSVTEIRRVIGPCL
jgi:hypothetical protein